MDISEAEICTVSETFVRSKLQAVGIVLFAVASAITAGVAHAHVFPQHNFILFLIPIAFLVALVGIGMFMNTVIRWRCPACGKGISSKEPWHCGVCEHDNPTVSDWGMNSMVWCCGNGDCLRTPTALECPHCRAVMFLTRQRIGRHAAKSLNAKDLPMPPEPSYEEIRVQRSRELEEKEHRKRQLEADEVHLQLEIKIARLNKELHRPEPKVIDPRQARVQLMAQMFEDAELNCRTIEETKVREAKYHSEIEAKDYPTPTKDLLKRVVSVELEQIRIKLRLAGGGDIPMYDTDSH